MIPCNSHAFKRISIYKGGFKVQCHVCKLQMYEIIDEEILLKTGDIVHLRFKKLDNYNSHPSFKQTRTSLGSDTKDLPRGP